jgi:hypothetical protein
MGPVQQLASELVCLLMQHCCPPQLLSMIQECCCQGWSLHHQPTLLTLLPKHLRIPWVQQQQQHYLSWAEWGCLLHVSWLTASEQIPALPI